MTTLNTFTPYNLREFES